MTASYALNGEIRARREIRLPAFVSHVIQSLTARADTMRENSELRRAIAQLEQMDDHRLNDLGLHRSDLTPEAMRWIAALRN